jgi:hypothetical protein
MLCGACVLLAGQGLATKASKEDWEEINFAFNSAILSDGYPSLLRLADLLARNPGYTVQLQGHTDSLGSDSVNDALSRARAEAVSAFLVRHGVNPAQIRVAGRGKRDPAASNDTKEGRFMNRRVRIVVNDDKGRQVGATPLGAGLRPIRGLQPLAPPAVQKIRRTTWSPEDGSPGCFAVQLGAFRERVNAERLRELVSRSSFRSRISPSPANPALWRVIVGCEATREAARDVARSLPLESGSALIVSVHDGGARERQGSAENPEEQ